MRVFRGEQGFWAHDQAIVDLNLGSRGRFLGGLTAST